MFHIVIDNGATYIHRDDNNMLMGFLINHDGIKEIVKSLPVSKYYVVITRNNGKSEEITEEQAFMLYDLMLEGHKNRKKKNTIQEDNKEKSQKKYSKYKI